MNKRVTLVRGRDSMLLIRSLPPLSHLAVAEGNSLLQSPDFVEPHGLLAVVLEHQIVGLVDEDLRARQNLAHPFVVLIELDVLGPLFMLIAKPVKLSFWFWPDTVDGPSAAITPAAQSTFRSSSAFVSMMMGGVLVFTAVSFSTV
jgi:hypothetical protein